MNSRKLTVILAAALCVGAARADELRLADGRVLYGDVVQRGELLIIETRSGPVEVRADQVVGRRSEAELRAEIAGLANRVEPSAFASLQLGRTAYEYGLDTEMWRHLDRCVEQLHEASRPAVGKRLGELLERLMPDLVPAHLRDAESSIRIRGIVRSVRHGTGPARREAVVALLTSAPDADEALLDMARRADLPRQRLVAIEALDRRGEQHRGSVWARALLDNDDEVRDEVTAMIRRAGDAQKAVAAFAPALMHDAPALRMRTAAALAGLGHPDAIPVLVAAGPVAGLTKAQAAGNAGVRMHMMAVTSRAYIRDFDVEIAQAAAVANPVVGVARSGVVLDVTVAAVASMRVPIERSYRRALQELAGADPGGNPKTWANWYAARTTVDAAATGR